VILYGRGESKTQQTKERRFVVRGKKEGQKMSKNHYGEKGKKVESGRGWDCQDIDLVLGGRGAGLTGKRGGSCK